MRLLYLSPTASMGGAERVLLDLLTNVRRVQPTWTIGLFVANDGPLVEDARRLCVKVRVLPFPREFARIGDAGLAGPARWARFARRAIGGSVSTLRYLQQLRAEIADFRPDVVHSNGIKMHLLGALARPSDAALVWHFHDYLGTRPVACRAVRRLKHRCTAVVAVSESVAADIREQLGSSAKVTTVWNAVNLTRFTPSGSRLDLDALSGLQRPEAGTVRVGLVATFARWKGHLLFLEALRRVQTTHRFRAYIVGGPLYETDGSQISMAELKDAIGRLKLESSVGLTGFVKDSAAALRSLDIVVHASTAPEPFGLVIAEAMACGRAAIVSDSGGVAELIEDGADALSYRSGDVSALSRQIERLIEDTPLRLRLGDAARTAAREKFAQDTMLSELLAVYNALPLRNAEASLPARHV